MPSTADADRLIASLDGGFDADLMRVIADALEESGGDPDLAFAYRWAAARRHFPSQWLRIGARDAFYTWEFGEHVDESTWDDEEGVETAVVVVARSELPSSVGSAINVVEGWPQVTTTAEFDSLPDAFAALAAGLAEMRRLLSLPDVPRAEPAR